MFVVLALVATPAIATTTWAGGGGTAGNQARDTNDPDARTAGTTTGGQFLDGPPSFALGRNGTTHYWYAAWTADRPPANESSPLVPYGPNCTTTGDPNKVASISGAATRATTSGSFSSYAVADEAITLDADLSATNVGTEGTFFMQLPSTGFTYGLQPGDRVVVAGVDIAAYNSGAAGWVVTAATSATTFSATIGTTGNADGIGGTATVHVATFDTSSAHTYAVGGKAIVAGTTPAGYSGSWNVTQTASTSQFRANLATLPVGGGTAGTWSEHVATFNTATATTLAAGSTATVAGYSGLGNSDYNGTWTVKSTPTTSQFTADILTAATSPSTDTTGNTVTIPPYCAGVYFTKSSNSGTSWGPTVTLSDPTTHADRYAIAANGPNVYAVWSSTVGYYSSMCADTPRVMYFTKSADYGATWSASVRLSPTLGRVDYPWISASSTPYVSDAGAPSTDDYVYVAATETANGDDPTTGTSDVVAYVSSDRGATFTKRIVGTTTSSYNSGFGSGPPTCPGTTWTPASVEGNAGQPAIAGDGTYLSVAFIKNDNGKAIAKISDDQGATWGGSTAGNAGCGSAGENKYLCTQFLTNKGAKGPIGKVTVTNCTSGPSNYGACSSPQIGIDSQPGRFGYAWVDDACLQAYDGFAGSWPNTCGGQYNTGQYPGVYAKLWTSAGGWGPSSLVSCFSSGPTACPNNANKAPHWDGYSPTVALFGTDGAGVAWTSCNNGGAGQKFPCDGTRKDNGDEILMKETGNGGATWGGDWGATAPTRWDRAVRVPTTGPNDKDSKINQYQTLVYDMPGASYLGCAQTTGGSDIGRAETGCTKIIDYLGRNTGYTIYRIYLQIGSVA